MELQELQRLNMVVEDDESKVDIQFARLEQEFTDTDRNMVLYSKVNYSTQGFQWDAIIPTVKIPYKDPSMGFLLGGVVFSSVGIYQRAPGIVMGKEDKSVLGLNDRVDIVTSRNSVIKIQYKSGGVQIGFRKGGNDRFVPIGIFLKAFSGLPYSVLLNRFAFKSPPLLNAFPCEVPKHAADLAKVDSYGIDRDTEPDIDSCIDCVYSAIMQYDSRSRNTQYSTHWKSQRIQTYFRGFHFKTESNYENVMSLHSRASGLALEQKLTIKLYNPEGEVEVKTFPKGTFVSGELAEILRWCDIPTLRIVGNDRAYILQEDTPMLFRAVGYKLLSDLPDLGYFSGDVISKEMLKEINATSLKLLEVMTPDGRKVLSRGLEQTELGDFYTIINCLLTASFRKYDETSQYEIANRVIIDYNKQVAFEVEQTYEEIASALMGCRELSNVIESLPRLPSTGLVTYLRDTDTKELSQAEVTNVMSRAIAERRASALIKAAPDAMTAVQKGQYARIDSLHSPESDKVGAVQETTAMSKLDPETGTILAPYEVVENGRPTGHIEYISAAKESNKYIVGWDNPLHEHTVLARYNGDVTTVARERVNYRDASPFCDMSVSRMTIPFPEFSQPRRSLMATKMAGQAVPLIHPERPMVSTGADTEVPCLYYTAKQVIDSSLGEGTSSAGGELEVVSCKWGKMSVAYTCIYQGQSFVYSIPFMPTDAKSLYNYNFNYRKSLRYGMDDVVFYNQSCDIEEHEYWERLDQGTLPLIKDLGRPALALGVNLVVMFKTYSSSTVDDAVVISDRLVANQKLSNIQILRYSYELKRGEYFVSHNVVPKLHSYVYAQQPVITVMKRSSSDGSTNTRSVCAKQAGEVIMAEVNETTSEAEVWVATIHDAAPGDKVAGRHGNKSVIAKIIPHYLMPYDPETGMTADIVVSPLSMPSRMNYGLVMESVLGIVMKTQGRWAGVTPFYPGIKQEVSDLYKQSGLQAKHLYNPVYGKFTERPVMIGCMYFMKLEQMSNLKYATVGYPVAVDPVFGQPVESLNSNKGQRIGEMESWALTAAGADTILQGLFSIYASDERSRTKYFEMLEANSDSGPNGWDESMKDALSYKRDGKDAITTQTVLRMFGLELKVDATQKSEGTFRFLPLNLDDIPVVVTLLEFKNHNEPVDDNEWCKIPLQAPVVNPFWINNFPLNVILGVKSILQLVNGKYYLNVYDRSVYAASEVVEFNKAALITGIDAVIALLRNTTVDQALERLTSYGANSEGVAESSWTAEVIESESDSDGIVFDEEGNPTIGYSRAPYELADIIYFLKRMKAAGMELSDLVWEYMPIMPKVFRQTSIIGDIEREQSFHKQLRHICEAGRSEDIYRMLLQFIGYGSNKNSNLETLRGYFFGKGSESGDHGAMRTRVLSKRAGFTGRAVIIPSADPTMSPFFVGVPWCLLMVELSRVLAIRLSKRAVSLDAYTAKEGVGDFFLTSLRSDEWEDIIVSLHDFNPYVFNKHFKGHTREAQIFLYHLLRREIRYICEHNVTPDGRVWVNGELMNPEDVPDDVTIDAAVVIIGRQPTLHKKSIGVYFAKLVDGYSIQMHPIVCSGYNADFDGDTMWEGALLGEMKNEGWKKMSCLQNMILEKDYSYVLSLSQDTALGIYSATIFKDNANIFTGKPGEYFLFDSPKALRMALEYGDLHYYDVVVYHYKDWDTWYISTAGRVLLNASVPNCFTKIAFTDPHGICRAVFGEAAISFFYGMKYDVVWTATGSKPKNSPDTVKIEDVLFDVYRSEGSRVSVLAAQALYEIGLAASDIYSVSTFLEDLSVDVDIDPLMETPREQVRQLNSLEQMGLISERERKESSIRAWNKAHEAATEKVLDAVPCNSNVYMMLYSGARGKAGQVMQSLGFVGTVSKTRTSDIEYPILKGYGSGLSSMDLFQTCYMARIGVVSTQAGTKDTGYSTRQTVYMSSGMGIKEVDCDIQMRIEAVEYSVVDIDVRFSDGETVVLDDLVYYSVNPRTAGNLPADLLALLGASGYTINEDIVDEIVRFRLIELDLVGRGKADIVYHISPRWRQRAIEEGYSYALPYTIDMKVTEESLNWVEKFGLAEVVLFDEGDKPYCFDREAYLPVDYDHSKYTLYVGNTVIDEERIYGKSVSSDTEGLHYFERLLGVDNSMTVRALQYLLKKGVHSILFEDGQTVSIHYKINRLFHDLVIGRQSAGLPHLEDDAITERTLAEVENVQLMYIPVRTSLTCLSKDGVCSMCNGKSLSDGKYLDVGTNLGIAAAQAQCEPLSQSTLNVTHSGGKRNAGVGQLAGLPYYMKMLQGRLVSEKTYGLLEGFCTRSGYVKINPHDNRFFQILSEDGEVLESFSVDDPDRVNVVDGAYVDAGDTVRTGRPVLERYASRDIFTSAMQTRYLLLKEYYGIFKDLNVSPRNYEILAREQTSLCYLDEPAALPPVEDTSVEIQNGTGKYILRVAKQMEVVNKFSGIAGFAFENVANMLTAGVLNTHGLKLNSVLGNIVTGTPIGSKEAKFIPSRWGRHSRSYRKSSVKQAAEQVNQLVNGHVSWNLELGTSEAQTVGAIESGADSLLDTLFEIEKSLGSGEEDTAKLGDGGPDFTPTSGLDLSGDNIFTPGLNRMSLDGGEAPNLIAIEGSEVEEQVEEQSFSDLIDVVEPEPDEDDQDFTDAIVVEPEPDEEDEEPEAPKPRKPNDFNESLNRMKLD